MERATIEQLLFEHSGLGTITEQDKPSAFTDLNF